MVALVWSIKSTVREGDVNLSTSSFQWKVALDVMVGKAGWRRLKHQQWDQVLGPNANVEQCTLLIQHLSNRLPQRPSVPRSSVLNGWISVPYVPFTPRGVVGTDEGVVRATAWLQPYARRPSWSSNTHR